MGNEKNLKPWKPGQSGNPSGMPKDPLTAKIRLLTRDSIKKIIDVAGTGQPDDLDIFINTGSVIERTIAKAVKQAMQKGDWFTIDKILERSIGKVKEELDLNLPKPIVITRPSGEQTLIGNEDDLKEDKEE